MPHTACNYYLDTALMARFKKKNIKNWIFYTFRFMGNVSMINYHIFVLA